MFFLYIKIDFWHGRSGTVMAFISDNISAHVHLFEDNDPIKENKDGCCQLGFSVWLTFHKKKNKSVSAKIITGLSLSILSAEKSQNFFQVVMLILEAGITFFLFKLQRQQCACNGPLESLLITRKMHLYRHLSRFPGRLLDCSSV